MIKIYAMPNGPDRTIALFAAPSKKAALAVHEEARVLTVEELSAFIAELMMVPVFRTNGKPTGWMAEKHNFMPHLSGESAQSEMASLN